MMKPERIRRVNEQEIGNGPIVYWMNREIRAADNWALLYAQQLAVEQKQPLVVVYNLVADYLGGGREQWLFKLGGLREVENDLREKNITFQLIVSESIIKSGDDLLKFLEEIKPGVVVTDFSPVRAQLEWVKQIGKGLTCSVQMVDAHNIIPAWIVSPKQEYGAYTLRPKLHKKLREYLEEFPELVIHPHVFSESVQTINWEGLIGEGEASKYTFIPGSKEALSRLQVFLTERLPSYATDRNNPLLLAQSDLSPYFHYGMLAPQRVALEVAKLVDAPIEDIMHAKKNKAKVDDNAPLELIDHASAYLEELVVRRELSDNFCFYNKNYDTVAGFPDWAKKSLDKERTATREFLYTKEQFEKSETHDELWNAAQSEMVTTGKMHGYMRMYWAKKILEWTSSPEEALEIAISLNDKYSLDGRDPNGYAGIAWSIGGVHDRSWFTRPVYGTVRYMARSGCDKRFDTEAYIAKFSSKE
jgi:deoxyribodipyrimidine photo-lyase